MVKPVFLKPMIVFVLMIFTLMIGITPAFASSFENTELNARSGEITLDIKFGQDKIKSTLFRTIAIPQLENIYLLFYGDEIILSEPELKVAGDHFRISSIPDGIIMYGHKNTDIENYDINLYFTTEQGFTKFSIHTTIPYPEDVVAETEPPKIINYVPKLAMTSSNDRITYWNDSFNVNVQVFDTNINREPRNFEFEGRVDDVDITVLISLGDELITILKGITQNGHWSGEHYFNQRSIPGQYTIDILASLGNQTISKSSSMYVIAFFASGIIGSGNNAPIADAGEDAEYEDVIEDPEPPNDNILNPVTITLDGTGSSDPDGDIITYLWTIIDDGETGMTLDDNTLSNPSLSAIPDVTGNADLIFELTVSDPKGKFDTDTVTITIRDSTLILS